jgi:hypothetical protein
MPLISIIANIPSKEVIEHRCDVNKTALTSLVNQQQQPCQEHNARTFRHEATRKSPSRRRVDLDLVSLSMSLRTDREVISYTPMT